MSSYRSEDDDDDLQIWRTGELLKDEEDDIDTDTDEEMDNMMSSAKIVKIPIVGEFYLPMKK